MKENKVLLECIKEEYKSWATSQWVSIKGPETNEIVTCIGEDKYGYILEEYYGMEGWDKKEFRVLSPLNVDELCLTIEEFV